VKNSIINAYVAKTGLSRNKLSALMDNETWMDARKAVQLHFADEILSRNKLDPEEEDDTKEEQEEETGESEEEKEKKFSAMLFPRRSVAAAMNKKLIDYVKAQEKPVKQGRSADELMDRLNLIKNQF